MKGFFGRFSCASFVLVLLILFGAASAFDISVYFDPKSQVRINAEQGTWHGMECDGHGWDYPGFLRAVGNNAEALQWWQEMGVNKLCVHYMISDSANDFNDLLQTDLDTTFKVINFRYPDRMFQYLEAQGERDNEGNKRGTRIAYPGDPYLDATRDTGSWGANTINPNPQRQINEQIGQQFVLAIGTRDGTEQPFFRPAVGFDTWAGWHRREISYNWRPAIGRGSQGQDSTFIQGSWDDVMPLDFRLVLDFEGQANAPTAEIAKFYWYFKNSEDQWLRYYPVTIDTTMILRQTGQFATLILRIDPIDYTFERTGTDSTLDSAIQICSDPFDWDPGTPTSKDAFSYGGVGYTSKDATWLGREGRFEIRYSGYHTLYVYSVEAMDDAYYKMFEAPVQTITTTKNWIESEFRAQYDTRRCLGWYTDESIINRSGLLKPFVEVNKILQTGGMPTFYINAWTFKPSRLGQGDSLFRMAEDAQVNLTCFMSEMYPFEPDSICQPVWPQLQLVGDVFTDYSSDSPYYWWENGAADCMEHADTSDHAQRYNARKSLQAGLDLGIWGAEPFWDLGMEPPNSAHDRLYQGLVTQAQCTHSYPGPPKFWALLQGNRDGDPADSNKVSLAQGDRLRYPTQNEIKLEAWLAVACDADGIMWYNFDFGGLLKWRDDANFCATGGASVDTTERYRAAKKACNEIHAIAPIFESLDFVKTYASRAFEREYPDDDYVATQLDTLATNTSWYYDHDYRAVEAIAAWQPDSSMPDGWSASWEEHPYVQVARFKNPLVALYDPSVEDYWLLIVNRRTLDWEQRKIKLILQIDTTYMNYPYYIDYVLGDSTKSAEPCAERIEACANRFVDVILQPGEAELVHFYRGEFGCDTTLAHIHQLSAIFESPHSIRLHWENITHTDEGDSLQVDNYFICGSPRSEGPFMPIGVTTTTTFLDSAFSQLPRYFYQVQACGSVVSKAASSNKNGAMAVRKTKVLSQYGKSAYSPLSSQKKSSKMTK